MEAMEAVFKRFLGDTLNDKEEELFRLIKTQDAASIQTYIKLHWKEINFKKKGPNGYTFLEEAIMTKSEEVCQILLGIERGIPIDDALILASKMKNSHVVNFLLGSLHKSDCPSTKKSFHTAPTSGNNVKPHFSNETEDKSHSQDSNSEPADAAKELITRRISEEKKKQDRDSLRTLNRKPDKRSSKNQMQMKSIPQIIPLPMFSPTDVLCKSAVMENIDIVQSLVTAGIRLPEISVSYPSTSKNSLKDFAATLELCKAKSSPVYIAFSEEDPILTAFQRNYETLKLSNKFPEYKDDLKHPARKCEQFAVDLLQLCQSSQDVCTLLRLSSGVITPYAKVKYGRLQQALQYNQKKFIAHPNCQNVVNNLWTKGLNDWRNWNIFRKMLHFLTQAIFMPFIMMMAVFSLSSKCTSAASVPLNRFIYSVTSYSLFLVLLTTILLHGSPLKLWMTVTALCFAISSLLRLFVTDLPMEGIRNFGRYFWNIYDTILYTMLSISFTCILIYQMRKSFSNHMLSAGESILAMAAILAYSRVLCWFHMSSTLGPFIIAFRKILFVVCRLLSIFSILFIAFSFSLYFLYNRRLSKIEEQDENDDEKSFSKLSDSFSLLFWALYGHGEDSYSLPSIDSDNSSSYETTSIFEGLDLVQMTGTIIWGFFHVTFVIILLNMLIAMMTNTFERIQTDCDREWKFARTKMQMYYFEECTAITQPFNLIHYLLTFPQWLWKTIKTKCNSDGKKDKTSSREEPCTTKLNVDLQKSNEDSSDTFEQMEYTELIDRLITDYFRQKNTDKLVEH